MHFIFTQGISLLIYLKSPRVVTIGIYGPTFILLKHAFRTLNQGQARGIWTYHPLKFDFWLYHGGPTLQSRITRQWLEVSLSFYYQLLIIGT